MSHRSSSSSSRTASIHSSSRPSSVASYYSFQRNNNAGYQDSRGLEDLACRQSLHKQMVLIFDMFINIILFSPKNQIKEHIFAFDLKTFHQSNF